MIFQGQELLEDEWFRDVDPIDWTQKEKYAGIFNLYPDLIRLRRNWHDNTRGLHGQHVNGTTSITMTSSSLSIDGKMAARATM